MVVVLIVVVEVVLVVLVVVLREVTVVKFDFCCGNRCGRGCGGCVVSAKWWLLSSGY